MQYSLKDLFSCVTLIAVGVGCWPVAMLIGRSDWLREGFGNVIYAVAILQVGAVLIGAGVFAPFRLKRIGGAVGFVIGIGLLSTGFG